MLLQYSNCRVYSKHSRRDVYTYWSIYDCRINRVQSFVILCRPKKGSKRGKSDPHWEKSTPFSPKWSSWCRHITDNANFFVNFMFCVLSLHFDGVTVCGVGLWLFRVLILYVHSDSIVRSRRPVVLVQWAIPAENHSLPNAPSQSWKSQNSHWLCILNCIVCTLYTFWTHRRNWVGFERAKFCRLAVAL